MRFKRLRDVAEAFSEGLVGIDTHFRPFAHCPDVARRPDVSTPCARVGPSPTR